MAIGIMVWALFILTVSLLGATAQVLGRVRLDGERLEMLVQPSGTDCPNGEVDIRQEGGIWSTVSLDMFDFYEGDLACQQLAYRYADVVKAVTSDTTTSTQRFALVEVANLSCPISSDTTIFDCPFSPGTCDHSRDVALVCAGAPNTVRLVPQAGTRSAELELVGRLELILGSQPGSVCSDSFDMLDANVACKQLGRPEGAVAFGTAKELGYDNTEISDHPIWLSGLQCTESDAVIEANLRTCAHNGTMLTGSCDHNHDVILSCLADGALRLVKNESDLTTISTSGRLEVYSSGQWGTVCGVSFNQRAADLACRQLGFTDASQFGTNLSFPEASESIPIQLDGGLVCTDSDTDLIQCSRGSQTCSHSDDVGLTCNTAITPLVPVDPVTTKTTSSPSGSFGSNDSPASSVLGLEAIIGIAVGGSVLVFLVCCLCLTCCCCCCCKCCHEKGKENKEKDDKKRGRARTLSDAPTVPAPPPPSSTITRTGVIEQTTPPLKSYQAQLSNVSQPHEPRYVSQQPNHGPALYLPPQTSSKQPDIYSQQGVVMNPNQTQGPQYLKQPNYEPALYLLPQTSSMSSQQRNSHPQQGNPQEPSYVVQQPNYEPASYVIPQTSSMSSQQRNSYYQQESSMPNQTQPRPPSQHQRESFQGSAAYVPFIPPSNHRESYVYDRLHYPVSTLPYPPQDLRTAPQNVANPEYTLLAEVLPPPPK